MVIELEKLFNDTCTVTVLEQSENEETGRVENMETIIFSNIPCHFISYGNYNYVENEDVPSVSMKGMLLIDKNIQVPYGSKIIITQNGDTNEFAYAGMQSVYSCHREIPVASFERWLWDMVGSIYDALCRTIKEEFTEALIFEPPITQGFKKGSFVVKLDKSNSVPVPGGIKKYSLTFIVEKHDSVLTDIYDCVEKLQEILRLIEIEDDLYIAGIVEKTEIVDEEKLQMTVTYSFYGQTEDYSELMGELIYDEKWG